MQSPGPLQSHGTPKPQKCILLAARQRGCLQTQTNPEGPGRHLDVSRGNNCLPTVSRQFLTRNYPRPNCLLKCLPNCLSPRREGLLSSFQINPAVRVIARQVRQKLSRGNFQSNLSGDTFSIEAPQNLLRTKEYYKNISSGKEFPFQSGSKLLRTFLWCLYRKGVAIHAYAAIFAPRHQSVSSGPLGMSTKNARKRRQTQKLGTLKRAPKCS